MMITKNTKNLNEVDFNSGVSVLIDKPKGWSSFKVVKRLRSGLNVKKIGHAGTLDPLATGLLIISTGRKTKEISSIQSLEKTYSGTILLGIRTPSMDTETEPVEIKEFSGLTDKEILEAAENFKGDIQQVPPMYSALKYGGKSLYKLARQGKNVVREPRMVHISEFKILSIDLPEIQFKVRCSKGTYIRVLADDLGSRLGTGGVLKSLRRDAIGDYSVDDAFYPDEFITMINPEWKPSKPLPVKEL